MHTDQEKIDRMKSALLKLREIAASPIKGDINLKGLVHRDAEVIKIVDACIDWCNVSETAQ